MPALNILIVRVSSLGDVVHNMPMVADILRRHPTANIDWVVEEAYASMVRLNPGVRHVIPFALRRWRKTMLSAATRAEMRAFYRDLRNRPYDLVFDTQGLLKTSLVMRMARLAPGGRRLGLANRTEGSGYEPLSRIFHTESVPVGRHTHGVLRGRLVAAAALDYPIDTKPDFGLRAPDLARAAWLPGRPYAVFFHGTARADKRWEDPHWVRLAHVLHQHGLTVLLPWGSDAEKRAAERLAAQMADAVVLPKLSMMEAVILAQQAALVVGVDTGLTHIAAAYERPTVELYIDSPRWKTECNWSDRVINLGDQGHPPAPEEVERVALSLLQPASNPPRTSAA